MTRTQYAMKRLGALEVRKKFGSVLDLVAQQRVPVTITRGEKALVVSAAIRLGLADRS